MGIPLLRDCRRFAQYLQVERRGHRVCVDSVVSCTVTVSVDSGVASTRVAAPACDSHKASSLAAGGTPLSAGLSSMIETSLPPAVVCFVCKSPMPRLLNFAAPHSHLDSANSSNAPIVEQRVVLHHSSRGLGDFLHRRRLAARHFARLVKGRRYGTL